MLYSGRLEGLEDSRTWTTRGLGRLEDLDDSRTWKTRTIQHTQTIEVIDYRTIDLTNRRTHESSNTLQPSPTLPPLELMNLRYSPTFECSPALLSNLRMLSRLRMVSNPRIPPPQPFSHQLEDANNSTLGGYKCCERIEEATNGQRRL